MSLRRKIAYSVGGLLLALIVAGLFLPATAHVERQVHIEAPPATVFALVNDFRRINQWSPWLGTDPNALYTISGPPRGVGATLTWDGRIVGQGSQVIIESEPFNRIVSKLDLGSQGQALGSFEFLQTEKGTSVTWSFDNEFCMNLMGRYRPRDCLQLIHLFRVISSIYAHELSPQCPVTPFYWDSVSSEP